jgi:hypothetical protein
MELEGMSGLDGSSSDTRASSDLKVSEQSEGGPTSPRNRGPSHHWASSNSGQHPERTLRTFGDFPADGARSVFRGARSRTRRSSPSLAHCSTADHRL